MSRNTSKRKPKPANAARIEEAIAKRLAGEREYHYRFFLAQDVAVDTGIDVIECEDRIREMCRAGDIFTERDGARLEMKETKP